MDTLNIINERITLHSVEKITCIYKYIFINLCTYQIKIKYILSRAFAYTDEPVNDATISLHTGMRALVQTSAGGSNVSFVGAAKEC